MTSGNNIESEYLDITAKNAWPVLYQKIRAQCAKNSSVCKEALKPQNRVLNRYRDVSPYDNSRIILQRGSTDYINANLVKVEKANRQYILTQGPLPNTVNHFWLMVWEQKSKAVLMLNKLVEKEQDKCFQYWPKKIGAEYIMKMADVGLTLEYVEQNDYSYYITRLLKLTDIESGETLEIIQFHYTTWPDFGVPSSPTAFLVFLSKVRDAGVLEADVGPAVVHCSAGIGRSGTFCLVDSCLVLIEKYGLNSVDVKEIILEVRTYRMGLIQTPEQLRFSCQAIIEGAKTLLEPNSGKLLSLENHIELTNNIEEHCNDVSNSDDEPPPLPPRNESLHQNGPSMDERPLPKIPISTSLTDFQYEDNDSIEESSVPSGQLPDVPSDEGEMSSEDELEEEEDDVDDDEEEEITISGSPISDTADVNTISDGNVSSPLEVRHRKRMERKEHLEAKVREIKRRQRETEQWTQLKRSLYKPLLIGGSIALCSGVLVAYFYFKN